MAQEKKVQDKEMPKEVLIVGGGPMFGMSQHLLFLAKLEAERGAEASWLRSQQKYCAMAKRAKKGIEKALRYLRGRAKKARGDSQRLEVCRPSLHRSPSALALGGRAHGQKPAR